MGTEYSQNILDILILCYKIFKIIILKYYKTFSEMLLCINIRLPIRIEECKLIPRMFLAI